MGSITVNVAHIVGTGTCFLYLFLMTNTCTMFPAQLIIVPTIGMSSHNQL